MRTWAKLALGASALSMALTSPVNAIAEERGVYDVSVPTEVPCVLMDDGTVVCPSGVEVASRCGMDLNMGAVPSSSIVDYEVEVDGEMLMRWGERGGQDNNPRGVRLPSGQSKPVALKVASLSYPEDADVYDEIGKGKVEICSFSFNFAPQDLMGTVTIPGDAIPGRELRAEVEHGSDDQMFQPAYQWYRGGEPIPGATGQSYTALAEDVEADVYCKVTDASGRFTGSLNSNRCDVHPNTLKGTVSVPSNAVVGRDVRAEFKPDMEFFDGTPAYRWVRDVTFENGTIMDADDTRTVKFTVEDGRNPWLSIMIYPLELVQDSGHLTIEKLGHGMVYEKVVTHTAVSDGISLDAGEYEVKYVRRGKTPQRVLVGTTEGGITGGGEVVSTDGEPMFTPEMPGTYHCHVVDSSGQYEGEVKSRAVTVYSDVLAGTVDIEGSAAVGGTLTARPNLVQPDVSPQYQWFKRGRLTETVFDSEQIPMFTEQQKDFYCGGGNEITVTATDSNWWRNSVSIYVDEVSPWRRVHTDYLTSETPSVTFSLDTDERKQYRVTIVNNEPWTKDIFMSVSYDGVIPIGSGPSYTVSNQDAGSSLWCVVNDGGGMYKGSIQSGEVAVR